MSDLRSFLTFVADTPPPFEPGQSRMLAAREGLQMRRIDTASMAAKMVQIIPIRYRSVFAFVVHAVCPDGIALQHRIARFVDRSLPHPAAALGINDVIDETYGLLRGCMSADIENVITFPDATSPTREFAPGCHSAASTLAESGLIQWRELALCGRAWWFDRDGLWSLASAQSGAMTMNELVRLASQYRRLSISLLGNLGRFSAPALAEADRDRGIVIGHDVPLGRSAMPRAVDAAPRSSRASILPAMTLGRAF